MYQQVNCKLEVLQKLFSSASTTNAKESAITLIKEQIQQFIEKSLDSGLDVLHVKSQINALCFKDLAVPTILVEWVQEEFEEKSLKHAGKCAHSMESACAKPQSQAEEMSLFSKDTLYHAGLCCEAVTFCQKASEVGTFFQQKYSMHSLEEISFSRQNSHVKPYLITKQGNTIYVAFRSETHLMRTGYDESKCKYYCRACMHAFSKL